MSLYVVRAAEIDFMTCFDSDTLSAHLTLSEAAGALSKEIVRHPVGIDYDTHYLDTDNLCTSSSYCAGILKVTAGAPVQYVLCKEYEHMLSENARNVIASVRDRVERRNQMEKDRQKAYVETTTKFGTAVQ